jgi:hypothetical protein
LSGNVNSSQGEARNVLFVNGSPGSDVTRVVSVPRGDNIAVELRAAPQGPGGPENSTAQYVLWVWEGFPSNGIDLHGTKEVLGCTANPTPLNSLASPQPIRCLRGARVPVAACGGNVGSDGPRGAPWLRVRGGLTRHAVFTVQAVMQDRGSGTSTHVSVTNAVVLRVE